MNYNDPRKGWGWGDRCVKELRAGKLGWARAACDRALALPDVDAKARPALLYNEGLIAKQGGDAAGARAYFGQSLALREVTDPGRTEVEKELRSVGGAPEVGALECRAKDGDKTIELFLAWDKNVATGSLRTTTSTGTSADLPVKAELYKGEVLVNPAGAPDPNNRIATMQQDGKKTIQVGDWHQPFLPCE